MSTNGTPRRGVTPGLPTNAGSFKADERPEAGLALGDGLTDLMDVENEHNGAYDPLAPQHQGVNPCFACGHQHDPDASGRCYEVACVSGCVACGDTGRPTSENDEPAPVLTVESGYEINRRNAVEALDKFDALKDGTEWGETSWTLSMSAIAVGSSLHAKDAQASKDGLTGISADSEAALDRLSKAQDAFVAAAGSASFKDAAVDLADALRGVIEQGDKNIRTFDGRTAEQWREQARESRRRSRESFERSDTDGYLSQWASDQMASKYDFCASIAEQGGRLSHPALFDLDGNQVPAKMIQGKFGSSWMLLDENGKSTGYVNLSKANTPEKRAVALAKKGYRNGRVMAPMALNHRSGDAYRADGGYSADNEVLYVVGADGHNPMRDEVEAEGGEFNDWYDG